MQLFLYFLCVILLDKFNILKPNTTNKQFKSHSISKSFINSQIQHSIENNFSLINIKQIIQTNKSSNQLIEHKEMFYKSLQQTILEYEKRKKETQTQGERKLFKWKVFALSFAILLIILIGIISQVFQNSDQDQGQLRNLTFLTSMLQHSNELALITSIKGMIYGLSQTQRVIFDNAQPIIISDRFNTIDLLQKIKNNRNIVFLFNLKEVTETQQKTYRFGMLLKRQYDDIDPDGNNDVQIYDSNDDMTSVYFSLNRNNALQMSLHSGCTLYNFTRSTGDFSIMETLMFRKKQGEQENTRVEFGLLNWKCFGDDEKTALSEVRKLTGIQLQSAKDVKNLQIQNVEVFYLTFNGGNI